MSLLELYRHVDDSCQAFLPHWECTLLASGLRQRQPARGPSLSDLIAYCHQPKTNSCYYDPYALAGHERQPAYNGWRGQLASRW